MDASPENRYARTELRLKGAVCGEEGAEIRVQGPGFRVWGHAASLGEEGKGRVKRDGRGESNGLRRMRNEFAAPGITLNNPDFKPLEFDGFGKQAGRCTEHHQAGPRPSRGRVVDGLFVKGGRIPNPSFVKGGRGDRIWGCTGSPRVVKEPHWRDDFSKRLNILTLYISW